MSPKAASLLACLVLAACSTPAPIAVEPPSSTAVAVAASTPPASPASPALSPSRRALPYRPAFDFLYRPPPSPGPYEPPRLQDLEALYASTPKTAPERPWLMRRLATEYVALEEAAWREQIALEGTATGRGAHPDTEAGRASGVVETARRAAIAYLRAIDERYPRFCHMGADPEAMHCVDEVLIDLAGEYERAGDLGEARKAYLELLAAWPKSRFVPDAYLGLAEALVAEAARDPQKLAQAEKVYLEALRAPPPENRVAGAAHYRLAQVYLRKGEPARALEEMTKAITVCDKFPALPTAWQLAKEARRDLIPIYARGGEAAKAYDFLAVRSGDGPGERERLHVMLDALAQTYMDSGNLEAAVDLGLDWLSRGAGPRRCAVVTQIDVALGRAASMPRLRAKVEMTAAASAPLMTARVQCAAAP